MAKKKETLQFLKIRDVKNPERGHETSAGIDFFVPKFNEKFINQLIEKNPQIFGESNNNGLQVSGTMIFDSGTSIQSGTGLNVNNNTNEIKYEEDKGDKHDNLFKFDTKKGQPYILLHSHQRMLIPSGIKSRMHQPGRALIAANKSGIASKHGVIFGAQVIDYEYQGEIHINVINTSTKPVRIYQDMKIIQFVETPVFNSTIDVMKEEEEISEEKFWKGFDSTRGSGGFGSTNKIQK